MLSGRRLIEDIDQFQPAANELAIWWLGQHSFVVKAAKRIIYFDPFLSEVEGRLVPPVLQAADIRHADIITGTHDHGDHIDRPVWPLLALASRRAKFVVPEVLLPALANDLNISSARFVGLNDGASVEVNGVRISAVAAAHEWLAPDPITGRHACLGLIVQFGSWTLYHAGDTCMYEGMITKLRQWNHDVIFLPINGRDAARYAAGIVGNLSYQEAADLAAAIKPGWVIPAHYGMFAFNTANPEDFVQYARGRYPQLRTALCTVGERMVLEKPTRKS